MSEKTVMRTALGIGMAVSSFFGLVGGVDAYFAGNKATAGMDDNTHAFLKALNTLTPPLIFLGCNLTGVCLTVLGVKTCLYVKEKCKNSTNRIEVASPLLPEIEGSVPSYKAIVKSY